MLVVRIGRGRLSILIAESRKWSAKLRKGKTRKKGEGRRAEVSGQVGRGQTEREIYVCKQQPQGNTNQTPKKLEEDLSAGKGWGSRPI